MLFYAPLAPSQKGELNFRMFAFDESEHFQTLKKAQQTSYFRRFAVNKACLKSSLTYDTLNKGTLNQPKFKGLNLPNDDLE